MSAAWNRVALRKESVDRNLIGLHLFDSRILVALRKESVDRNNLHCVEEVSGDTVALRKESVDRNYKERPGQKARPSRSPQGERG